MEHRDASDGPLASASRVLRCGAGDLEFDFDRLRLRVRGRTVAVDGLQLRLLLHFACHPDRVLSRAQLLAEVWGEEGRDPKVVDVLVCRLRKRLDVAAHRIESVRSFGYRFNTGEGDAN